MSTTIQYCDRIMARLGLATDYQLAKALEVHQSNITRYRRGGTFGDVEAERAAKLLDLDPLQVIADANIERAKRPEEKALWQRLAKRAQVAALAGIVACGAFLVPQNGPAGAQAEVRIMYIMSNARPGLKKPDLCPCSATKK